MCCNILTVKVSFGIEKGIKIVFASDFHIKPHQQKRLEKIVDLINSQNPDLVLSAGDFVSGHLQKTTMPPENIAKGFGLTVEEIDKMDKNVWSSTGGQYCFYMYDADEVKNKYLDIYNDIFSSSFSIDLYTS